MKIYNVISTDCIITEEEEYIYTQKNIESFSSKKAAEEYVKLYNNPKLRNGDILETLHIEEKELHSSCHNISFKGKYESQPILLTHTFSLKNTQYKVKQITHIEHDTFSPCNDTEETWIFITAFTKENKIINLSMRCQKDKPNIYLGSSSTPHKYYKKSDIVFYDKNNDPIKNWEQGIYW